jgi:error-prone DNA polymerase
MSLRRVEAATHLSEVRGALGHERRGRRVRRGARGADDAILRSLYLLDYIDSPPLRQHIQHALNRGEPSAQKRWDGRRHGRLHPVYLSRRFRGFPLAPPVTDRGHWTGRTAAAVRAWPFPSQRSCALGRVYAAFCAADTVGVFQLESRAQISFCLPRLQPRCLDDLAVAVALIRPGPVQGGAVHPYLRRRQGLEPVRYPGGEAGRRLLEPILGATLGICLFQDEIIALGRACGLAPDETAELRRAMSSGRSVERMAGLRARLDAGLAAHGLDEAARAEVLTIVEAFSSYGFVKGHAYAFAYLSYVSCALKVFHPAAFCAALLNAQPMGFYPAEIVVQDAERHGVRVLPVDVRFSRARCTLEGGAVRLGLRQINDLGAEACARIEAAMGDADPPASLEDLCARARLDEEEARALARSGALQGFASARRQALWQAPLAARAAREHWLPALLSAADPPVQLPRPTEAEELMLDRRALGFTPGRHVLSLLRQDLAQRPLCTSAMLRTRPTGCMVQFVGQVVSIQRPRTAHGVTFLALSDEQGLINVVILPQIYTRDRRVIRGEVLVWVRGVVEHRDGSVSVRVLGVRPLADALTTARPSPS